MSLSNKARKSKTDNSQTSKSKSDNKQESTKQSEKTQPTAEQMRIAQIIDTKTEDPYLKEKIKQVMDATQKPIDDVYTALHDCDNDPNRAVNLLLEGIKSEWSTSSKKKKNRTTDKTTKDKDLPPEPPAEEEHKDPAAKTTIGNKAGNSRGGGKGRGFRGGRVSNNSQNGDSERMKKNINKVSNGPSSRGRSSRKPQRGFGRGRGTYRRPMETWDSHRTGSSNMNHENHSEDWDNEEYTGSLAKEMIFTSSGTGNSPPSINSSLHINNIGSNEFDKAQLQVDIKSGKTSELSSLTIPFHKPYGTLPETAITPPVGMRSPTLGSNLIMISPRAERSSMLMAGQQNQEDPKITEKVISPPIGVRTPPMPTNLIMMTRGDRTNINNQEIRMHKPRPKIPPPSKIPASAVEMPPDSVENHIGLLDVQFGALELNETSESIQVSPPTPHHTPSPVSSEKLLPHASVNTSDSLLLNETNYSPVRNNGTTSITQINDLTPKVPEVSSSLYPDSSYQSSPYSKAAQQSQSVYSSAYSSGQMTSTSSIIYSTSSSQSTYSSSSGVYGGISSSYPQYQYNNYPSQQTQTLPVLTNNTSNSYQSVLGSQHYGSSSQSVYGSSGLPTPSYSTPYQTYNSSVQHNHKQTLVSSSTSSSKEFETSQPSVNLSSISHSGSINPSQTLLSGTQATSTSKPTGMSSMGKNTMVTNMPPGVPPLVGAHQYIMGQGGIPYFQQPMYYEDLQLMQQQRIGPHISTGYYEMGYPTSTTREGVYNMNDGRFARTDNTSPVQASSITQQSGSQSHQQPAMINQPAMPPAYAYIYGSSTMIPGNFQYGAPLYPVAAGGTSSSHGNASSGVYSKGPSNFSGNYGGIYENSQGTGSVSSDFKTSTSSGPKVQPSPTANPSTTSDIAANIYSSKTHSALSKSYDKQGFHCATPPPFNLGSQNSGIGPGGGYPQHLFIPAMTPHHNTTPLMHQPIHQDGSSGMSGRSQGNQPTKVVMTKANYSSSTYWTQN